MVSLCMGGGHFDNRADEERLQEKEGKQEKKHVSTERSSLTKLGSGSWKLG